MKSGSPSRTTAAHKTHTNNPGLVLSRLPLLSLLLLFLPKLLHGTRDRWVAQVSFIIIYSTSLAPFPRLSAPPHSSQLTIRNRAEHSVAAQCTTMCASGVCVSLRWLHWSENFSTDWFLSFEPLTGRTGFITSTALLTVQFYEKFILYVGKVISKGISAVDCWEQYCWFINQ